MICQVNEDYLEKVRKVLICQVNEDYLEKVRKVLNIDAMFIGRFREENTGGLVYVYNFHPSTIVLHENGNGIEIGSKLPVSQLHSKLQLEKIPGGSELRWE